MNYRVKNPTGLAKKMREAAHNMGRRQSDHNFREDEVVKKVSEAGEIEKHTKPGIKDKIKRMVKKMRN